MGDAEFLRARQPEQIQHRRSAILRAAEELLAEDGVDRVSLNAIARRANLAKSNIYRYFESREQIFLTIHSGEFRDWAGDVKRGLEGLAGRNSAAAAAGVIARGFADRERFCELNSVLSMVLEHNVSEDTILDFKTLAGVGARGVADSLHRALPSVSEERCWWALKMIFALVAGLWPQTRMSPEVDRVLARPELQSQRADFEEDLAGAVRVMLYGLQVEAWRSSGQPVGGGE